MNFRLATAAACSLIACLLAGCAGSSDSNLATASIPAAPKIDPVCSQLAAQIGTLRSEGVAAKVEKAAAKKYRMKPADLSKAAQLNKANEDYQSRCGTVPVQAVVPAAPQKAAPKSAAIPAVQPATAGLAPPTAVAAAPKQLSPESVARAKDAAAARAAMKSAQMSSESQMIGN